MSTNIKTITGRYEASFNGDFTSNYEESEINLTRFYGGVKNGTMIQVTISNDKESAYVQLTKDQVKSLSNILKQSFDYSKYPSD